MAKTSGDGKDTKRKTNSEKEVIYSLTFLGLLAGKLGLEPAKIVKDDIELYLRRHYAVDGGYPAIIFNMEKNDFEFGTVKFKK